MRQLIALAAAATLVACGGGDGGGGGGGGPQPTPASVTVSAAGSGALVSIGDTRALTAVVRNAAGAAMPSAAVSWSVSGVAVSLAGTSGQANTATAAANGSATITASSGTVSGSATVDVAQRLAAVAVAPNPVSVSPTATRQLAASARDARDNGIAGAGGFTFVSDNNAVATVDGSGLLTGVSNGSATITVALTRDGVSVSTPVPVTVLAAPSTATVTAQVANAFSPTSVEIAAGGSVTWVFQALHNVSFTSPGSPDDITERSTGSVARTFAAAGTFAYTCTLHAGMNGQVVVR